MFQGSLVQEVLGLVDLGRQIGGAAAVGMIEKHDLLVRVADLFHLKIKRHEVFYKGLP